MTETVGLIFLEVTPVISTILEPELSSSSIKSAVPNLSSVKLSMSAIGLHPMAFDKNSTSSLSISLITIMFNFDKKCNAKSLTASLRMDFGSTTHYIWPFNFLQIFNK